MNELLTSVLLKFPLWATQNQMPSMIQQMGKNFSADTANDSRLGEVGVLIFAVIAVLGIIGVYYYFFVGKGETSSGDNDQTLFRKLCQIHQLKRRERKILQKISKTCGLDTSLPFFIEPKFFEQSLTYESLESHRPMIRKIFNKLFEQSLKNTSDFQPSKKTETVFEAVQKDGKSVKPVFSETPMAKTAKEAILSGEYDTSVSNSREIPSEIGETIPSDEHKNAGDVAPEEHGFRTTPRRTVAYPSVPGASVLTSLVKTVNEMSSEIAATSIRHTLSDGNELNQRTFNAALGQTDFERGEDQTPAFPKSSVPTPEEMLFLDPQHRHPGKASPTPRFLQTKVHVISPPGRVLAGKTENVRESFSQKSKIGETLTMDDVALLEKIVREKTS